MYTFYNAHTAQIVPWKARQAKPAYLTLSDLYVHFDGKRLTKAFSASDTVGNSVEIAVEIKVFIFLNVGACNYIPH